MQSGTQREGNAQEAKQNLPPSALSDLLHYAAVADFALTDALVGKILQTAEGARPDSAGSNEFLLPLDANGEASLPTPATIQQVAAALAANRGLADWVQVRAWHAGQVLLVSRRLCHRIGLRHQTVQLILDHPTHRNYTLIQLRGFDKVDAPGCFDMPCAGHVIGLDTIEASLEKELAEELGLRIDDLTDLRPLTRYEYRDLDQRPDFRNIETRAVYRARLRPDALVRIRFTDGEVAGLTLLPVTALQELVARNPQHIASGLRGALPWY